MLGSQDIGFQKLEIQTYFKLLNGYTKKLVTIATSKAEFSGCIEGKWFIDLFSE